jgi:hypothetical protein
MAATDHTRLRTAGVGARTKSTDKSRQAASGKGGSREATAESDAADTLYQSHPGSRAARAVNRSSPDVPSEAPALGGQIPIYYEGFNEPTDVGNTTVEGAPSKHCGVDDSEEVPSAGLCPETLLDAARAISEIHGHLMLAYAMGLTFERAVRSYIPIDDPDILPCLSIGVLDVFDRQLRRLDALVDRLARTAAHISLGPSLTHRSAARCEGVCDPDDVSRTPRHE